MILVEDRVTPLTEPEFIAAMARGYVMNMGAQASPECLSCLGAQGFLESGRGKKMRNFTPGNKKTPPRWDGLYAFVTCDEIFDAQTAHRAQQLGPCTVTPWRGGPLQRVVLAAPHPWSAFCAYENAAEGCADYVQLLSGMERYRAAWHLAQKGDPDGFARALGHAGYFTAPVDVYARGVVSIAASLLPLCRATLADGAHELTDDEAFNIAAAVSNTIGNELIWTHDRHTSGNSPEPFPLPAA